MLLSPRSPYSLCAILPLCDDSATLRLRERCLFEMPLPDAPVGRLPVGDEGLRFRRREAQRPGAPPRGLCRTARCRSTRPSRRGLEVPAARKPPPHGPRRSGRAGRPRSRRRPPRPVETLRPGGRLVPRPCDESRASSLSIFAKSRNVSGSSAQGSSACRVHCNSKRAPTFVSHQCDFAPADRSQRCIRPPSYITQTACGGLTPAGAANFWTSGNCSHHRVWRSRSQTRSAPIRSASRSTRFVVNWTSAISARLSCVDWKEGSFVAR